MNPQSIAARLARRARTATLASVLAAVSVQGVILVSGVLVARLLGPQNRGHLALIVFIPSVLAQVGHMGMPQAATYFIAKDARDSGAVARSLRSPVAVQSIAVVTIHALALPFFLRGAPSSVWLAGIFSLAVGPAILTQQYGLAILQGQKRFLAFNVLWMMPATAYAMGVVAIVIARAGSLLQVAGAWAVAWCLLAPVTAWIATRGLPPDAAGVGPSRRVMLRFGLNGFLGSVSPVETFRLDQAAIGLFLAPAQLGLYVVGLAFTNLPRFVAQSIGRVAYPSIVSQRDPAAARSATYKFFLLTLSVCGAVILPLILGAGPLVRLFFGADFAASVNVMRILLVGALFSAGRSLLSDATRGLGRPHLGSIAEVVSWVCLLPALATLTPMWGIDGVAVALATSSVVSFSILLGLTIRGFRPTPIEGIKRVALVGLE